MDNFTIDNLGIGTNRDGIDIDLTRNVHVSNTSVNSPWDDAICLKSSFGLGFARATEMVTITNCFVSGNFEEGTLLDATYKRFAPDVRVPHTGRVGSAPRIRRRLHVIHDFECHFRRMSGFGARDR